MTEEYKQVEVTYKYYLPDNQDDLWLHQNASNMHSALFSVDQLCRSINKHDIERIKDKYDLAEEIREMIRSHADIDKVS